MLKSWCRHQRGYAKVQGSHVDTVGLGISGVLAPFPPCLWKVLNGLASLGNRRRAVSQSALCLCRLSEPPFTWCHRVWEDITTIRLGNKEGSETDVIKIQALY